MKTTQACQLMLVLFALAMFMMFTRSRENYTGDKNMGYAVAKTLLGMYVDGRRAVCAVTGDSRNVDLAVEVIYNRSKSPTCPPQFKTSTWKDQMNQTIDQVNKNETRRFGPGTKVITTRARKLLVDAAEKFARNCKKNNGKITKDMIRENIMGFRKAMCSKKYYNKPSRFVNRDHISKIRQEIAARGAGASSSGGLKRRGDRFVMNGMEIEDPRAGARGPNGETYCEYMNRGKCKEWDSTNNKLGVGYMKDTPIITQAAIDKLGFGRDDEE